MSTGCLETLPPPKPAPIVVANPLPDITDDTPETKLHPRKPRKVVPKPVIPPPPPQQQVISPPPVPASIISMRRLEPAQAHGLLDSEVQRPDGKIIGRAVDLVVDSAGKPNEIIVNLTGFMGVGDRKMNFPLSAFRFNTTAAKKVPITLTIPTGCTAIRGAKSRRSRRHPANRLRRSPCRIPRRFAVTAARSGAWSTC